MIQNVAFQRKVLYLGIMALLMIPLYMIGHPAAGDPMAPNSTPGGKLSQLRTDYDLSQAELGEIDPASESMKLATLGMRGVAANILWTKANEYKKKENWEKMIAVVNQMAKLQPNYVTVWEFQSHNLSYNISVEHDDYRFRYQWVKKGIEYLIKGTKYNRKEPRLFWTVGWYTGQKFGRADESKQFRRLFHEDRDFHESLNNYVAIDSARCDATGKPDNWLVARLWFNNGYDIVENMGVPIRGKSPHIFYADGPKSRMNYAVAIEAEGILDEKAEYAWKQSGDEWKAYGDRQVPTSQGLIIRLNDREAKESETARLVKQLDQLAPGVRDRLHQTRLAGLTAAERKLHDTPLEEIQSPEDYDIYMQAMEKVLISSRDVAENSPQGVRARCNKLTDRIMAAQENAEWVGKYRSNVNFEYWRTRCEVEQKPQTVKARRHIYVAGQLRNDVEVEAARKEYELAWHEWAEILNDNPNLMEQLMADDLLEDVQAYIELLGHLEEKLPADFELLPLLRMHRAIPDEVLETEESDGTTPEPDAASNTDGKKPAATPDEGKPAVKKRDATEDADVKKPDAGKPDAGKPGTSEKSGAKKPAASEPTRAAPNAKKPKDDEPAGDAGTDPPPSAADDPDTSQG
ncbi:MAG: hypothetical protein QF918_05805 [Pirellulaceae bacterium]|nr:hypothetical protein [Pirellulaceae bacterium]